MVNESVDALCAWSSDPIFCSYLVIWTTGRDFENSLTEEAIKSARFRAFSADTTLSFAIGKHSDNFDGQIAAISLAVDKIKESEKENIVFFVDSKVATTILTTPVIVNKRFPESVQGK
ncbi:hypothetical protein TNCV_924211 [Trichonephila clavipes]|nr:hypothetical protein TNCV_924211 [Trichonephila clavipes]